MTEDLSGRRLARNPIAIVGMSGLFPMARDHREYWQNIVDGVDCTTEVPESRWKLSDYHDADPAAPDKTYARRGAFLPDVDFDPVEFGLPPNQLEVTSTMQTLSLGVARDVLRDAGATDSPWYDAARTGVVLGTTGPVPLMHPLAARLSTPVLIEAAQSCGLSEVDAQAIADKYVKAFAPWEENSFPGLLANVVAGRVANRLGLGGINCTVDAACAASLSALRVAIAELLDGRADTMITGGVDTENSIFIYLCFSKVGALSKTDRISPFAKDADGTLLGEGIGMLALRRLSDAERDGNRIYAVIRGLGSSSDGRAKSIYAPVAAGQRVALDRAYEDAEVSPSSVELFEAHATGTAVGDRTELEALGGLLVDNSDERHFAALGSVKSQIGHTKGAAGTASVMKLALGLYHRVLPGTINVDAPNPAVDFADAPFYVNVRTRPWVLDPHRPKRRAAASAMGFGGTNFHVVLEEHTSSRAVLHRAATAHLWHAPTPAELLALLKSGAPSVDGGAIPPAHARLGLVAGDDVESLLEIAIEQLESTADSDAWSHPRGVHYRRSAPAEVKVAGLFAGQGSQYLDMGLEAALNVPVVADAFDEANAAFAGADLRLGQVVFPPPVFDAALRQEQEAALRRTEHAQPAIGALSAGQFRFLRSLGLECSAFAGHSFGEVTALWAAGSLSDADFFALARARGAAMAPVDGDAGTMAAVQTSREDVVALLADFPDVVVCNHNAPDQVVVGGPTQDVRAVVEECGRRGVNARLLPVAAAFHTRFVAHAVDAFRPAVEKVGVAEPAVPVFANSPGASYSGDVAANAAVLSGQLLEPVEFVATLEAMKSAGVTVFVEFGPKQVLTQLVRRTLGDDVVAIPTDSGPLGDGDVTLKEAAVRLAVLGVPLESINRHTAPVRVPAARKGMTVSLSAPEYVPPARAAAYRDAIENGHRIEPVVQTRVETRVETEFVHIEAERADVANTDVDGVVQQHLALHGQYLDTQLRVAEQLADALSGPADVRAITAVAEQSVAIGNAHSRANEVLAALAELEAGAPRALPPARVVRAVGAVESELKALSAPPSTNGSSAKSTNGSPAPAFTGSAASGTAYAPAAPVATTTPSPAPAQTSAVTAAPAPAAAPTASPVVTAPAAAPAAIAVATLGGDLKLALREVVADKTGYPVEMVDPGMDLEADLGVDSIKRVQVLGAVQERFPELPTVGPEQLGELRTLDQIAAFLTANAPSAAPVATPAPTSTPAPAQASPAGDVRLALREVVADKTGYPVEMVDPGMDLEADLGVDSIKRVQVLGAVQERFPHLPTVGPEQLGELRTLDQIAAFLESAGGAAPKAPEAGEFAPRHAVGLVTLPPVDRSRPWGEHPTALVVGTDTAALRDGLAAQGWTVRSAASSSDVEFADRTDLCLLALESSPEWADDVDRLADAIAVAGKAARADLGAFVTLTRLDGGLGLHGRAGVASLLGGVGGLVKTFAAERPELFCRAVDVDPDHTDPVAALLDELHDSARDTAEVGVAADGTRSTVVPGGYGKSDRVSVVDADGRLDPVVLGADDLVVVTGGARGVTALCVTALAEHTEARFVLLGRTALKDEPEWARGAADLKQAAIKGLDKPTPKDVRRAVAEVEANREIRDTLAKLGGRGEYAAVDVTDADAVREALSGRPVAVVVHGAGVLADAFLRDKTPEQVRAVFGPKLAGLRAVLDAVGEPRHLVLFTSVAGLLGNPGQADYAVANEALCRFAAAWRAERPERHAVAIDWGAWDGGMVTDDLRRMFHERGISLVGPRVGARAFVEQFTEARLADTCVLIGEDDALGGATLPTRPAFTAQRFVGDLERHEVVQAHRIGAHAVLPATFALGWLVNVLERAHPGLTVVGAREFQVHKGIVFDGTAHPGLTVEAEAGRVEGDRVIVKATVRGDGKSHYGGTFVLARTPEESPRITVAGGLDEDGLEIYRQATQFHGPRLQGLRRVLSRTDGLVVECRLADADVPGYRGRLHSPVLADLLLQGPPVLGKDVLGGACLPLGVGRADWYAPLPDDEPFLLVLDHVRPAAGTVLVDATASTADGRVLQRFADVTVVSTPDMSEKFRESVRGWQA
ncbi:beta-ketoacyl synthase N-terminal-like domain-containing protein [Actinosynnema sp. NPDC020468]|uniref:beta-ketoacyl synthase N-terminal-like domain-containing protein n=1 Tax=Actinosynnema sp. NPDC020468 TaxID=3154488 RepID=UPI00340914CD